MRYPFLFLSLTLAIPGLLVYALRADLRPTIRFAAALALPFALTERLFYPEYWRPRFVLDLVRHLGFGIEDLLFVAALAAVAVASYPVVARLTFERLPRVDRRPRAVAARLAPSLIVMAAITALTAALGLPVIYGVLVAMIAGTAIVWRARPDLVTPALGGAATTTVVYHAACLTLALADPQVFHTVWRTRELSAVFVLGVPLEELLYAAASGFAASIAVPHARGERLTPCALPSGTRRAVRSASR